MTAVARVGDIAQQIRGVTYTKGEASSKAAVGYLPVLRAGNITTEGLTFDDLVFVPARRISDKQRIRQHDIVVAASSGSLDVVGKTARALADWDGGFGAFCKVLRPGSGVDPAYFAHYFRTPSYRRRVSALAAGVNINNLRGEHLDDLLIPLPPLPDQRRIAAILDKADALRAARRAGLAQLDALAQSIFLDMFGDPATNPKGWPVVSVGDFCDVKGGKRLPKGEEYAPGSTPFRYIRVMDFKGGVIDESALMYLKAETQASIARYVVHTGDVIISIAGSIGLVAPVPASLDGVNLTENAAKLVAKARDVYEATFLARYLESKHAQAQIRSHVGQVTIGKLALFRIEKIQVPLAPLTLQAEYASRVAVVRRQTIHHTRAAIAMDALFRSLQHRAFRGEL